MSRRRVPAPEKKVPWTISIDPGLKKAAQAYAIANKSKFANESVYVCGLIERSLKRNGVKIR